MGACKRENDSSLITETLSEGISSSLSAQKSGLNPGIAGDFAILSKSGITELYVSAVTVDVGASPITTTAIIPADISISGGPNDVWIFQIAGAFNRSCGMYYFKSGAQAKNMFWQTAGVVTLDTASYFEKTILRHAVIKLQTGAWINIRLLAHTAVTLQKSTVVQP